MNEHEPHRSPLISTGNVRRDLTRRHRRARVLDKFGCTVENRPT